MVNYYALKNNQENNQLIKSFFMYTQQVFKFDLEEWRSAGQWDDKYAAHALTQNEKVIAGIGASIMKLQVNKENIPAVQLGSVGVLQEFRGRGFARTLMEKVLNEYMDFPLIFLFASDNVSEFYTKLGFKRVEESYPYICIENKEKRIKPTKLTIESEHIERLLNLKIYSSSIIDARYNNSLYRFHLMYSFKSHIYYIKEKDVIFIAEYNDDCVELYDVLSENKVTFEDIKDYIIKDNTKKVRFHFTPDWLTVDYNTKLRERTALYVYGELPLDMSNSKFPGYGVS